MTETTTGETLDAACKRVTQEAVAESLAFIARAFDDTFDALAATEPKAGGEREVLAWLTDRDNLILHHDSKSDAWTVRLSSLTGEVRGKGQTPFAALSDAYRTCTDATPPQQPTAEPSVPQDERD